MGIAFYVKCPCLVSRTSFALSYLWIFAHVLLSSWNTFPKILPPHLFFSLPLKVQLVVEYLAWMSHPLKSLPSPLPPAVWDLPLVPAHPDLHLSGCSPWHAVTTCSHFSLRIRETSLGIWTARTISLWFLRCSTLIQSPTDTSAHWCGPSFAPSEHRCSQLIFSLFQLKSWVLGNGLKSKTGKRSKIK